MIRQRPYPCRLPPAEPRSPSPTMVSKLHRQALPTISCSLLGCHLRRLARSVARAIDDDLVRPMCQAVERGVPENGVIEEPQPLVHTPIAGKYKAAPAVPLDDQLVQVAALLGRQPVQPEA